MLIHFIFNNGGQGAGGNSQKEKLIRLIANENNDEYGLYEK